MSKADEKYRQALAGYIRHIVGINMLQGEVKSVDEERWTCDVELPNTLLMYDVQLKCLKETAQSVVLVPKVGSWVQMLNVGDPDWMVIAVEQLDKIVAIAETEIKVEAAGSTLLMNKDQVEAKSNGQTIVVNKDGIVMNGGGNEGVPIAKKVEDNDNSLKSYINTLTSAVEAALTTVDAAAGSASVANFQTAMAAVQIKITDTQNTKVKH